MLSSIRFCQRVSLSQIPVHCNRQEPAHAACTTCCMAYLIYLEYNFAAVPSACVLHPRFVLPSAGSYINTTYTSMQPYGMPLPVSHTEQPDCAEAPGTLYCKPDKMSAQTVCVHSQ